MLIRICSAKCIGVDALKVTVEVNISNGIGIHLVGLADAAVKESLLRTVTALQSLGFKVPGKKIVINLAPADMHKKGSGYDLPIALGIIAASEQMEMPGLEKYVIMGELGLDGTVRPVPGALPVSEVALKWGYQGCILPLASALETAPFGDFRVFAARNLKDVLSVVCRKDGYLDLLVNNMTTEIDFEHPNDCSISHNNSSIMDFSEIMGQENAKRGLEIAAAGGHNVIMVGPPGSGKSSLAKAMCRILPPMTREEALQTSKIYSVSGRGISRESIFQRPFRAPHVTSSIPALVGGGSDNIVPGEISLAHNGILFMDEFCEIPKRTIEVLRSPMEERSIILSRLKTKVTYPANFTLVAATNPCPCGYYGEGEKCTCTVRDRKAYLSKLSGPIMDRIDIQLFLRSVQPHQLMHRCAGESSATVASRVIKARDIQRQRFKGEAVFCNADMSDKLMQKYCSLSKECSDFLEKTIETMGLSARACSRIMKLSRTIADLNGDEQIRLENLAEAVSYRFLDRQK